MRKYAIVAAGLLLSLVLGATVFREPIAWAAQVVDARIVGPVDNNGNVAVHEQGVARVDFVPKPVVGGGGAIGLIGGTDYHLESTSEAQALAIHFTPGSDGSAVFSLKILLDGREVAVFRGPYNDGADDVQLGLSHPILFDELVCQAPNAGPRCSISWVGAQLSMA